VRIPLGSQTNEVGNIRFGGGCKEAGAGYLLGRRARIVMPASEGDRPCVQIALAVGWFARADLCGALQGIFAMRFC
jgi:hypothetical protein